MSARNNKLNKTKRGRKRPDRMMQNALTLVDTMKAMPNGATVPMSDIRDGASKRNDVIPTRIPRNINDQVVWSRILLDTTNNLSATIELNTAANFRLNQHPEASSYEAIFDQYCIVAVRITVRTVESVAALANNQNAPRIYTVLDHDDSGTLTVAQCREYSTCIEQKTTETVTRILYPRLAIASYSGAFTSFANDRMWVDCASDSVQHYGFKISAEVDARTGGPSEVLTQYEIYYAFRNRH